jgi:hypothetical protein
MQQRANHALIVAGGATFLGVWLVSAVAASVIKLGQFCTGLGECPKSQKRDGTPLYIPIVGPWIAESTMHPASDGAALLALAGIGQLAGATLLVVGLASPKKVWALKQPAPAIHASIGPLGANVQGEF